LIKWFNAIEADLIPKKPTAKYFVPPPPPPYDVPHTTVHFYVWQALGAIDHSQDPLLGNIKPSTHATAAELEALELVFASLSNDKLRGTIT